MATKPAGCGHDVVALVMQLLPWLLARGAPSVLNNTPELAVVSLDMTVLLMMFTSNASCSEIPAPSQPATLLAMMLFVTVTSFQQVVRGAHGAARPVLSGKRTTSVPLTFWKRIA